MSLRVEALTGDALAAVLPAVARLRIEVFRDFPYLYDGSEDYERRYLAAFAEARGAVVVAALDGDEVVGVSTGVPLAEEIDAFRTPFAARGYDVERVFYCAESVLRPAYRGRGLGHRFFGHTTFCAVLRPQDHPLRPAGYRPLDAFWRRRGYAPVPGLTTTFSWKDLDRPGETEKPMQFWLRALSPA